MLWLIGIAAYLAAGSSMAGYLVYQFGYDDAGAGETRLLGWQVLAVAWLIILLWLPAGAIWLLQSAIYHIWFFHRA